MRKLFFQCNLALSVSILFIGCNPSANNSPGLLPFLLPSQNNGATKNSNTDGFQLQNSGGRYSIQSLTAPPLVVGDGVNCTTNIYGNVQDVAQNAIDITPDIPLEVHLTEYTMKYCFFKMSQATYNEFHMFASAVSAFGEVEIRVGRENEIPATGYDWEFDANAGWFVDESLNSIPFHDNSYRYIWLVLGGTNLCSPLDPCKFNFSVVTTQRPSNCSVLFDTAVNNPREVLMGESVSVQTASANTVCMFKYRTNLSGGTRLSISGNSNDTLVLGYLNSKPTPIGATRGWTTDVIDTGLRAGDTFRYVWVWTGNTGCDFDNCSFTIDSSHLADPAIQSASLSKTKVAQEEPITVTYEMKNLSSVDTFGSGADVEHFLDTNPACQHTTNVRSDGKVDFSRTIFGYDHFSSQLLPLQSVLQTYDTVIPYMAYFTSRVMYYCLEFDPLHQIPDQNYGNNRKLVTPVTIFYNTPHSMTDLVGLGFSVNPSRVEPGVPFDVSYTLTNTAGSKKGSFTTDFDIDFRLSRDPSCSADDILLVRERIAGGMQKGAEIFHTLSLTLPADLPIHVENITQYVCAMFDSQNVIAEIDEDNNTIVMPIVLVPSPSHSMYYITMVEALKSGSCFMNIASAAMKLYDSSGLNQYSHDVPSLGYYEMNSPNLMFYYLKQGASYNLKVSTQTGYYPYSLLWSASNLIGTQKIVSSDCTPASDIYEPNDTPGSAGLLPLDTRQEHHLDLYNGDTQDWIKLVVP